MDANWTDAVNVAALYYPDREVSDSMSVDLFSYDDGYTEYCTTDYFKDVDVVDEAGEPYVVGSALGVLSRSATDNVTYTVIDGELVKLIDREWDYSLEEITVIYTRAEISGSAGYILGDADGNGEIESVDATFVQRYIAQIETPFTKDDLLRGDIDGTGDPELFDVTCIQRYLCQMKTPYPIGETVS